VGRDQRNGPATARTSRCFTWQTRYGGRTPDRSRPGDRRAARTTLRERTDAARFGRRTFLLATSALVAGACTRSNDRASPSPVVPVDCAAADGVHALWATAIGNGLIYGSSAATWQLVDTQYRKLFAREAAMVFTEDDLLWWRLRPTPRSALDFWYADRIVDFARRERMLVLGAHLVWDQGFGKGWSQSDFVTLDPGEARRLLFGTLDAVVGRYRGRVAAWIVANEVLDAGGLRIDVPWYIALGQGYVAEAFRRARDADPGAVLLLNDFGYETDTSSTSRTQKRDATLRFLDEHLADDVPIDALGIQAHLDASTFDTFDPDAYRRFLSDVADRGLDIFITELDVLDDGLSRDVAARDATVADIYGRYLEVALDEPAIRSLTTFGLSDRYTWLQEDYPRSDGAARRPLPFDARMQATPALGALRSSLADAPARTALWRPLRCR
jgi:endo-1,4-beta-xylanase